MARWNPHCDSSWISARFRFFERLYGAGRAGSVAQRMFTKRVYQKCSLKILLLKREFLQKILWQEFFAASHSAVQRFLRSDHTKRQRIQIAYHTPIRCQMAAFSSDVQSLKLETSNKLKALCQRWTVLADVVVEFFDDCASSAENSLLEQSSAKRPLSC